MTMQSDSNFRQPPWLTVVMPSYRGEHWIANALQSLAAECAPGVEVILVDGGPTPAARTIAAQFCDRIRLRILAREDLQNWHGKTNLGVQIADSPHVCLLCVDDVWLPGRAAAVRAWIEAAPAAPLHLAPSTIIDREGCELGVWHCPLPPSREISFDILAERLLVQNFIASPAPVFRKDAWLGCAGLDETLWYTADWDIWLKLAAMGPTYYHPEPMTGFRIHGDSLTIAGSRDSLDFEEQMRRVLERHLPRLKTNVHAVERAARTSIAVNIALARASAGKLRHLWGAAGNVLQLGPAGIHRYLRDSRIVDRVMPRLRARMRGSF
jgi:glycosyltransferase involved in cell wall biosynthesis